MMTMADYRELSDNKRAAAYELLGFSTQLLDDIRDGMAPDVLKRMWRAYDEKRLAYECASRDLDECLSTEAMRQSFGG